jgi:predicted nucleic acid-binding protein
MIVVFDSSVLIDLFNPRLDSDHKAKIDDLISTLKKERSKILVPTPSLTELMTRGGSAKEGYYDLLSKSATFQITPFDARAAMDCAILLNDAFSKADQRKISKTKFKFDWQIAAIAASRSADIIFSEDADLERCATRAGIQFKRPSVLPLPPSARQTTFGFPPVADGAHSITAVD